QAEEAVEVEGGVLAAAAGRRHRDRGSQLSIRAVAVGDHDVQSVAGAALEDDDQRLAAAGPRGVGRAQEHPGRHPERDEGEAGGLEEEPPREHRYLLWNCGEPRVCAGTAVAGSRETPRTRPAGRSMARFSRASSPLVETQASAVSL